jgi:MFS family permease
VAAVGLIGLAEVVPLIVFSLVGGAAADRRERRGLIAQMQTASMLSAALLMFVSFVDRPNVLWIYALVALSSSFEAIERPARTAMLPSILPEGKMPAALAVRQVAFHITLIVGPGIGGILIAVLGVTWVYAIDTVTYLAALAALRWIPKVMPDVTEGQTPAEAVREGLRYALRTPLILSIFVIDLIAMIFGMPRAVFPELAQQTFDGGARVVGLLYAAPSVGALAGALLSGWVTRVRRHGIAVILAVLAWGTAITLAGFSTFSLALTLFFLAIAGASDVISAVFRGSMLLEATPDRLRGRVSSLNLMVVIGGPRFGDVEAGLVAAAVGAPASIAIGGVACLLGAGLLGAVAPALRGYRTEARADPVPTPPTDRDSER